MRLRSGSATSIGAVREHNEDSLLAAATLFAVADGMGGHSAGEVASGIAVECLNAIGDREDLRPEDVNAVLARANEAIFEDMGRDAERIGMGTTVAGIALVWFAGTRHWCVFNIGDSRVYRFVDGVLSQLTIDHSEVEELVSAGRLTAEAARRHPRRNVVTRALGMRPTPPPDLRVLPPIAGERYLVCTDGLTQEVTDDAIAALLRHEPTAPAAADALVRAALAAGGRDNIAVIVVDHLVAAGDEDTADTVPRMAVGR